MNKIIKALIVAKHPSLDIDVLMEVISATRNEQVATELLCGLYEEPIVSNWALKNDGRNGGLELTFKSYDKWRDQVTYTFQRRKKIEGYFDKSIDKTSITLENFDKLRLPSYRNDATSHSLETNEWETREDYCDRNDWERYSIEWSVKATAVKPLEQKND